VLHDIELLYSCCHRSYDVWSPNRDLHFGFGTSISSEKVKDDDPMQCRYVMDGMHLPSSHTASPESGV
jgi:hypothetical protein